MNFRNTPDLLDGVLRRCGELTTSQGVSPRLDSALLYLNQIHHTMVTGGNELNLDIDEPWIWARARQPIVIQLNPSITSGTVSLTQGSANGTFNVAPQVNGVNASVENWHIRPVGFPEIYRIASHTSGSTSFTIDAPYPQVTNSSLNFAAFQIDYDLVSSTINIDKYNDTFNFSEDQVLDATRATVTHGAYTPGDLATAIAAAMTAVSRHGNTYTGVYSPDYRMFTFSSDFKNSSIFTILGGNTPNNPIGFVGSFRTGWDTVGFDYTNLIGSSSYLSTYPFKSIIRLSQPARVYYGTQFFWGQGSGQVGNLDVVAFDRQYPLLDLKMGTPEHFCVIEEKRAALLTGALKVRFNKYLSTTQNMRVEFDYIPQPKDLYNNGASFPLLPRKFVRILEFGASYYLCVDKEDSRQGQYLQLAQQGLQAMMRLNRREMERSGTDWGQVIARPDLVPEKKRALRINDYGYTASY